VPRKKTKREQGRASLLSLQKDSLGWLGKEERGKSCGKGLGYYYKRPGGGTSL